MILTRRTLLAGAAAAPFLPLRAAAQADDGFVRLEARPGALKLVETGETQALTFGGASPGPVIRVKKGEELKARLVNGLDQPTSIHWRGVRGPNAMDGVAPLTQKPVAPGETFDYRFTPPDAGVFLYHAHAEPTFAAQTERGLAGVLLVEDPASPAVDRDLVVVLDDWKLDDAGALAACGPGALFARADLAGAGRVGALVTVNGKAAPERHEAAPGSRVRLRLVNAATARIMPLTIEGAQPMVVAIDGQPCTAFPPVRSTIPAGPGARFDVVFDMPAEGETARLTLRGMNGEADRPVMAFESRGAAATARPPIEAGPLNPLLPEEIRLQNARRLDLVIEAASGEDLKGCADGGVSFWRLNGKPGPLAQPLFSVKRGAPVSLGFVNKSAVNHVMRVHGHVVRQLHLLDDGWEPYWRDSVIVPAGRTVRVAFVADNPGRWRLGAGVLEHAAAGLAAMFEVT
jgi:FtsP/CotA-like multicopper oxidase with cupredoxin domain